METRNIKTEVKAEGLYLVGRPIVFGQVTDLGWCNEIIEQGALSGADLNDVRFLVNHNTDMVPLARYKRGDSASTMRISVDGKGMEIRVELDVENNADARSLYSAVKRGDITGMSFGFIVASDSWEDMETDHPTRHIKAIRKVAEVSACTFPAYPQTSIKIEDDVARRSWERERQKQRIRILSTL